jgi:hypothetical protein
MGLVAAVLLAAVLVSMRTARAQECTALLDMLQQGMSSARIAGITGLSVDEVEGCRRQVSQPIFVGPAGSPPLGAAGPVPRGAAGPPPMGAPGPPPIGAAGPPPVGHK